LLEKKYSSSIYNIITGMKNNCKDNDVVDYKEKAIIVVFSCIAFNILLLITIAISQMLSWYWL
jgi:hypothetical protein